MTHREAFFIIIVRNAGYLVLVAGIIAAAAGGCASIIDGTRQTVTINSYPSGAQVDICGMKGVTPATFELKRNTVYNVTVSKEGYRTEHIVLNRKVNPWIIGNILYIPAVIVDFIDGAAWVIKPGDLTIALSATEAQAGTTALYRRTVAAVSRGDISCRR